jgi:hypothetical protein
MSDERDDFEARLQRRLAATESRIPAASSTPDSPAVRKRWLTPVLIAGSAIAVLFTIVAVLPLLGSLRSLPLGGASPSPNQPALVETRVGDFVLTVSSPRTEWTTNEAVEVSASLAYVGDEASMTIGQGIPPILFTLAKASGEGPTLGGWQLQPCKEYVVSATEPIVVVYTKGTAIAEGGSLVEEAPPFDRAVLDDPDLHLPPGEWEFTAATSFDERGCKNHYELTAAIVLRVVAPSSDSSPASIASQTPSTEPTPPIEPTPTVEPTPSPSGQACMDAMTGGILGADPEGRPLVQFEDGPPFRIDLSHLDEFIRIESEPVLTIYNRRADTIATEGDFVELIGGFNADGTVFHACGISRPPTGDRR